jgi:hypothetical protein
MSNLFRPVVLVFALALIGSPAAPAVLAQPQKDLVSPSPLDSDHPRARQAAALVTQLLAGDRGAVLKILQAEGTEAVTGNAKIEAVVDSQIARLAHKGYTIDEFMTARGADVIVQLTGANREDTNIVIRFTADEPHRIEGFAQAMPMG